MEYTNQNQGSPPVAQAVPVSQGYGAPYAGAPHYAQPPYGQSPYGQQQQPGPNPYGQNPYGQMQHYGPPAGYPHGAGGKHSGAYGYPAARVEHVVVVGREDGHWEEVSG